MERLCSWPPWISARIRSHSRKGPERPVVPPDHGCDGETVSPSLHSSSQTSAGKPTIAIGISFRRGAAAIPFQAAAFVMRAWPLHSLGHGMSISEVILVPLPKRLCIRGRNLLHIVAKRGKLASNIVRRHSRFDANEAGWQVRKPQCDASARDLLSQQDGAARIEADQVKGVLAHIYSDGGHCVKSGRAGHGGAPFL